MNLSGNTILITGGTSGIGRALAETFHQRSNQVIVAGRRQALLDEITAANSGMVGLRLDVQDPVAVDNFMAEVEERFPGLNMLINNAGISREESFPQDISQAQSIIQTNVVSVLQITNGLLPVLKQQPCSTIITTTSGLAFVPRINYPTYCASKAFLHSWIQSLRFQLSGSSIKVLELVPPYVQTELAGPGQAEDPNAMPLAHYIREVFEVLEAAELPDNEILVERVKTLRWAERHNDYDQLFKVLNGRA